MTSSDELLHELLFGSKPETDEQRRQALKIPPGTIYRHTFSDMGEYADAVVKAGGCISDMSDDSSERILHLARHGWEDPVMEAFDVADRAVSMVETEVDMAEPVHAVTGAEVDIGAYMSGEPECMVEYPFQKQSNVGNVVTMIADVQCSAGVSNRAVMQRGFVIAGLAMALNRLGHQTDLWVSDEYFARTRPNERVIIRTHVKSPNDFIDPARIMFAYAHPGVQRGMGFGLAGGEKTNGYGAALKRASFGPVTSMTQDMPDGTVYMPPVFRGDDTQNADAEVRRYLVQLGLLEGDDDE